MRNAIARMMICFLAGALLYACAPPTLPPTVTPTLPTQTLELASTAVPSAAPTVMAVTATSAAVMVTATPQATSTPAKPSITKINIDGDPSDWSERAILFRDPTGDAEAGSMDLTEGSTFVNQQALYLLVKAVDPKANFVRFHVVLQTDANRLLLSWRPGESAGGISDLISTKSVGLTTYSSFAFKTALEMRVDLRDLGSPQNVRLMQISVMIGTCCNAPAWRMADQWQSPFTPVVNEIDPPRVISNESQYVLARQFHLPEGYLAQKLYVPPLAGVLYIARSQSGIVYLSHSIQNAGISILDPVKKKATRILDLPSGAGHGMIVGGPVDTALIDVNEEIWQVSPDGSHKVWGKRGGRLQYYTANGRLLGTSHDGTAVVELLPDGNARRIATGFGNIFNLVASADNRIFVSDGKSGNITRINADGSQNVLVERLVVNDPIDLGLDEVGNLYFNSSSTGSMGGFFKIDSTTGAFTSFDLNNLTCTEHPTDFVFIAPGMLVLVDPTISQAVWVDLNTRIGGILVSSQGANTHAATIGPDDALYTGTRGCGADFPAQVLRLGDDGARSVYLDGLEGEVRDIEFDPKGGLYIATGTHGKGGALLYISPSGGNPVLIPGANPYNISSIALERTRGHLLVTQYASDTIAEFSLTGLLAEHRIVLPKRPYNFIIDSSQDGRIYAFVSEWERRDIGPVVDRWLLSIDLNNGTSATVFAREQKGCCVMGNLDIDQKGSLWWLPGIEFQIYRVEPNGTAVVFAQNLPIDPAAISVDRQGDIYFTSAGGIYRIFKE